MDQQHSTTTCLDFAAEIDQVRNAFEAAWKAGQHPQIEEHLKDLPEPHRSKLLRELLLIECNHRFGPYDTFPMSEFMSRFPDHAAVIRGVLMGSEEA